MTDIVERLEAGVPEVGLHEDNNTELFDIEASNDTMFEAAVEIRRLREQCEAFAKAVIELSDNVEARDGLSDTTEYTVDAARAYPAPAEFTGEHLTADPNEAREYHSSITNCHLYSQPTDGVLFNFDVGAKGLVQVNLDGYLLAPLGAFSKRQLANIRRRVHALGKDHS